MLQAAFVEKLKGDFENLSIAIADLPVGLIPFPDRCALQTLLLSSTFSTVWEMVHTRHKGTSVKGMPSMSKL